MILTPAQVKELRNEVNAAHVAGDAARAQVAQAKLHAHFVADSDAFFQSEEGRAWMERQNA